MRNRHAFISKTISLAFVFFLTLPLVSLALWGFAKQWPWPDMLPRSYGFRALEYFLSPTSKSLSMLASSVGLSMAVTLVTLVISIPAAKALGIYKFRGKRFFEFMVLAPIIVPPVAVGMGIHVSFIRLGLANTFVGVLLVHLIPCLPYGIRILTNVFEIVGESMENQARVLGARPLQTFFYITLPLLMPGIISAGSLVFIVSFSQYFLTFLIGGGRIMTFAMVMFPYIQSGDRMLASFYSVIFVMTTVAFLMIMEKTVTKYYKAERHFYL